MVVAAANVAEASLVPGVQVIGANSLIEVIVWLRGGPPPSPAAVPEPPPSPVPAVAMARKMDLAEVLGQAEARLAAEICAAGGHNLSLLGPPGAGKTMLAERLPTILPDLDTAAALEVTSIHSVAGRLPPGAGLMTAPPFCAPHHTSSMAAIVGGGSGVIRPGAASLAHHGILFLDEAPEFHRDVLDALRQPLESGEVVIARVGTQAVFPARFTLVLAANPCPCARTRGTGLGPAAPARRRPGAATWPGCPARCSTGSTSRSACSRSPGRDMLYDRKFAEPSAVVAERVAAARERCAARLAGTPWRVNAEVPGTVLRRSFPPQPGALTSWTGPWNSARFPPGAPTRSSGSPGRWPTWRARTSQGLTRSTWRSDCGWGCPSDRQAHRRGVCPRGADLPGRARGPLARPAAPGARRGADTRRDQVGPPAAGGTGTRRRPASRQSLRSAMERWRTRLPELPSPEQVAAFQTARDQARLPRRPGMAGQLADLGDEQPYALWLRGQADLRFNCLRAVAIVGSRAATAYGSYVAAEFAASVAARGLAVVSGGAFGVDAAAHRGALGADGVTVAVLACGVDTPYPAAHAELFDAIAAQGVRRERVAAWPARDQAQVPRP